MYNFHNYIIHFTLQQKLKYLYISSQSLESVAKIPPKLFFIESLSL